MSTATPQHDRISAARSFLADILQSSLHQIKATMNRILPPESQENLKQVLIAFATSHPVLATLLLSQAAFSAIPLILFVSLTIGIFVFSLAVTLALGLLGALMATLFCMGLVSMILIPTLCLTTFLAGGVWLWGWGVYYIVQWVGSGDTVLLTRLSLLLAPQKTWAKQCSELQQDEEQPTKGEHDTNGSTGITSHDELQSLKAPTDLQASIESNGYPEKYLKESDIVEVHAVP